MLAPQAEVLGEVALDPDGVLHGWCWSPARPAERLMLDILVDDLVIATVVASRFREDIRNRKFGDGYHGFTLTLTKQLSVLAGARIVSARERVSRRVFWHKLFGDIGLPAAFGDRLARMGAGLDDCSEVMPAASAGRGAMLGAALGEAGRRLRAARRNPEEAAAMRLAYAPAPAFSLVLDGGADAGGTYAMIAAAAAQIEAINAELILIDHGADPRNVYLASRIANLRYLHDPRGGSALRRNMAAEFCRGGNILFLRNTGRRFGLGLLAFAASPARIAASPRIAAKARLAWPERAARLAAGPENPFLGLELGIERALFDAIGGFDESLDDGDGFAAAQLLMRATEDGEAIIWREPAQAHEADGFADGFLELG